MRVHVALRGPVVVLGAVRVGRMAGRHVCAVLAGIAACRMAVSR